MEASEWTPSPGGSVEWTVTVLNRSIAAAAAENAEVWFGVGGGTGDASVGPVPDGWQISWSNESGVAMWSADPFPPGSSVSFVVTTSVSGSSGSTVEVHATASASNQWHGTPRPGSSTVARGVIDGSHLWGTVVADATGAPLGDVCVDAYGAGWWSTSTRPDGSWDLAVASGSDLSVRFQPRCQVDHHAGPAWSSLATPYAVRWWPGSSEPAGAVPVDASSDQSLGEARLVAGGAVAGTVTVPDGADSSSLWVSVESAESGWWIDGADVKSDGSFFVHGLPPGEVVVGVSDGAGELAQRFYDGVGSRHLATPVLVHGGAATTGVDIAMAAAASIAGTVTDAGSGAPLANIAVSVRTATGDWVAAGSTASNGTYSLSGIPAGEYLVRFDDPSWTHVSMFHDGSWSDDAATPLTFDPGSALTVDVAMEPGVVVTGQVTAAVSAHGLTAGDAIPDVAVIAWPGGFSFEADPVAFAVTGPGGTFEMGGLPPTDVAFVFIHGLDLEDDDDMIHAQWAAQFWPGVSDPFAAGVLDLSDGGATVSGVDAALLPAPVFTGRVLDAHGGTLAGSTALGGMAVGLFVPGDDEPFAFTMTEPDGSYQLASPFADFDVYIGSADLDDVYDGAYPPRWHLGAAMVFGESGGPDPIADGATPVRAAAGTTRSGVHVVHDPPPAPGPPHIPATIEVHPGDATAVVRWPVLDLPIDEYVVVVDGEPIAFVNEAAGEHVGLSSGDSSPMLEVTVDGLTNGQAYEFAVTARNLSGEGTLGTMSATPGAGGPGPGGVGLGPVTTAPPFDPSPDTGAEPDPSDPTAPVAGQPGDHVPGDVAEADPAVDGGVEQPGAGTSPAPVAGQLPLTGGSTMLLVMWALIALVMGCAVVIVAPRR